MNFDLEHFWKFCGLLTVSTKEKGEIRLTRENMLGTQVYFMEEVTKGLAEGKHEFWVLKGRQVAVTTICLALDLYWSFKTRGMSGALVTHDEKTREMFRATFKLMLKNLPTNAKFDATTHNRELIMFANHSRFAYLVAGTRKNTSLGKGGALIFAHCTEVSEYGDAEGMASLQASFAQDNPNRFFIYESTAQGYNHFYDAWEEAKKAVSVRAIFIGWWRNHLYRRKRGSAEHNVYWDGKLSHEERTWTTDIRLEHAVVIDDEQMAWWRWMTAEKMGNDLMLMYQNYPPTERYAFVKAGSTFFDARTLDAGYKRARRQPVTLHKFSLGASFENVEMQNATEKTVTFRIWEAPVQGGHYVVGADPAYGSSDWADRFCASVWRCYADKMIQVAEFCTPDCLPMYFAWLVAYMSAYYIQGGSGSCMLNLELNGPGQGVWTELKTMKRMAANTRSVRGTAIANLLGNIRHFKYRRIDSFSGPTAFHTQMNGKEKERMLNLLNDNWVRGDVVINSPDMLDEMKNVERTDGFIGAPGRGKDDRVIAAGLAVVAWYDFVRVPLQAIGLTYAVASVPAITVSRHPLASRVTDLMAAIEARG